MKTIFLTALLFSTSVALAHQKGDTLESNLCPIAGDLYTLKDLGGTDFYSVGEQLLDCQSDPNLYLLKQKDFQHSTAEVAAVIAKSSPESLFFGFRGRNGYYPDLVEMGRNATIYYYQKSGRCGAELFTIQAAVDDSSERAKLVFSSPQGTGVCLDLTPTAQPVLLRVLDSNQDYQTKIVRTVLTAGFSSLLIIVEQNVNSEKAKVLSVLSHNDQIFPKDCGKYLVATRLLPGSTKLALFYRSMTAKILDYSERDPQPSVLYQDPYNGASTCEGSDPTYFTYRDRVYLNPKKRQIGYLVQSRVDYSDMLYMNLHY